MRIAMWSGPRNLSTAMMYSFANRADCAAVDEPLYAAYLAATGLDHPMREEILAAQPHDPAEVVADLLGPIPNDRPHFYQKHMTHHILEDMPWDWIGEMTNIFLIRHPARVIASYGAKRENPTLDDIGFRQQAGVLDHVEKLHCRPVVIDSHDIRDDPEGMLCRLCDAIGLPFDPVMLSWPSGGHDCDGVWAPHWYGSVWKSTGFAGVEGPLPEVPEHLAGVLDAAIPYYEALSSRALKPA